MLLGITGPSGAGKGCVTEVFKKLGFEVIDADQVAREVVRPGEPTLAALAKEFGGDIIRDDGSLDRRALAQKAFTSPQRTQTLNGIMHGEICRRMTGLAESYAKAGKNCLFDAPLLIEAGLLKKCDACIAVIAPPELRIARLTRRDGLTEQEIRTRLSRQHDDEYYTSRCQFTVINDGDLSRLVEQTETIARLLLHP